MEKFEIGTLVNAKVGNEIIFGRIEKICENGEITVSDGTDLYDVHCKDITRAKFNTSSNTQITNHDPVNHPSHYTDGKIEVIDFINDKKMNFNRGNVIKYVSRAGKKASKALDDKKKEIQDLEKAKFYLEDEIKRLKQELEDND